MVEQATRGQNATLFCTAPVVACVLIGLGAKLHLPNSNVWTVLTNILYPAIAAAACVLTAIGLRQASSTGSRWLPSFIAMTMYKALAFCLFCTCVASGVKMLLTGYGRVSFVVGLAFPALMIVCALLAVVIFAIASLIASLLPSMRKPAETVLRKAKTTRIANATILCAGLVLGGIICVVD